MLEYLEDAILHHTPQTLSDERTTSPDDANAKHARVVSSGLLSVDQLLQNDSTEKPITGEQKLQELIANRKIYEFAIHHDASVRKALYRVLQHAVDRDIELDWKAVSKFILAKALKINQSGSTADYIDTLLVLTKSQPPIWATDSQSKSPLDRNLCTYIQKGSQRGPESWWPKAAQLVKLISSDFWSHESSGDDDTAASAYTELLKAFRDGVGQSDEPRQSLKAAWMAYLDLLFWILSEGPTEEAQNEMAQSFAWPPIQSYLLPTRDSPRSTLPPALGLQVSLESARGLLELGSLSPFAAFYEAQIAGLVELMKTSLPQSSQKFSKSQDEIIATVRRFTQFQLGLGLHEGTKKDASEIPPSLKPFLVTNNAHLIEEAVQLLKSRDAKPYGSAGVIYTLLDRVPTLITEPTTVSTFLQDKPAMLLESPSAELLVLISVKYRSIWGEGDAYECFLSEFLQRQSLRSTRAYTALLHGLSYEDTLRPEVQNLVLEDLQAALKGDQSRWANVQQVLTNQKLTAGPEPKELADDPIRESVLEIMMNKLSMEETELEALNGFEALLTPENAESTIKASGLNLRQFLHRLIMISHSSDDQSAAKASKMIPLVRKMYTKAGDADEKSSTSTILISQLEGEGEQLPISSLIEIAQEFLKNTDASNTDIASIFPTSSHWEKALLPFLRLPPPPGLALITSLRGCAHLVDRSRPKPTSGPARDMETFSVALRLALFVTKLFEIVSTSQLPDEQLQALYHYYPLVLQLADDKLNIEGANALWVHSNDEIIQEISEATSRGRRLVNSWTAVDQSGEESSENPSVVSLWAANLQNITDTSPHSFHVARATVTVLSEASESNVSRHQAVWDRLLAEVKKSPSVLQSAAALITCQDLLDGSARGTKLSNELVANAMDLNLDEPQTGKYSYSIPSFYLTFGSNEAIDNS